MFLGNYEIDDTLVFSANTHNPSTGAAADVDGTDVPAYRVYKDETGTAILTGDMTKLDDANTLGFYSEQLTLSAANGFENGKSYTIYISATVNSIEGTISHSFTVGILQRSNVIEIEGTDATDQLSTTLMAAGDVDGYTLEETLKLCLAALAGKLSGADTTTVTIRAADDSKARITATVDSDGNRSAVTLDETG